MPLAGCGGRWDNGQAVADMFEAGVQRVVDLTGVLKFLPARRRRDKRAWGVLLNIIKDAIAAKPAGPAAAGDDGARSAPTPAGSHVPNLLDVMVAADEGRVWSPIDLLGQCITCERAL
jgi:hypothetical protein